MLCWLTFKTALMLKACQNTAAQISFYQKVIWYYLQGVLPSWNNVSVQPCAGSSIHIWELYTCACTPASSYHNWTTAMRIPKRLVLVFGHRSEAKMRQGGYSGRERGQRVGSNRIILSWSAITPCLTGLILGQWNSSGKGADGTLFCLGKSPSCFYSCLHHKQQQNLISSVNIPDQYRGGMNYLWKCVHQRGDPIFHETDGYVKDRWTDRRRELDLVQEDKYDLCNHVGKTT